MIDFVRDHAALLSAAGGLLASWWNRRRILKEMRTGFADIRGLIGPAARSSDPIVLDVAEAFPLRSPYYAPVDYAPAARSRAFSPWNRMTIAASPASMAAPDASRVELDVDAMNKLRMP